MTPAPAITEPPKGCALPAARRSDGWVWYRPDLIELPPSEWNDLTADCAMIDAMGGV